MTMELVKFLQKIGVDTRFVSIMEDKVYINNLKFSRFSRKKEELFKKSFPEVNVIRSKIFQKICMRASRNLAHCIQPKEKIFLIENDDLRNFAIHIILEPYQRKYGIELIFGKSMNEAENLDIDSIALPITLDDEAQNILQLMLDGEKIELLSSNENYKDIKLIYPLINVPKSWIYSWTQNTADNELNQDEYAEDLLKFLERLVPGVRENLLKSALFISCEC
ncbi:ATPase [Methanobacterium sp. MBAC-LM]|uniref:ATPase n=1 Tax=Methanobacterium sp. MBAC-LM TaxID=3412034 RepID=UPI003C73F188